LKRINLLDNNTSNKIAAGEVVERPLSVVKEMMENSIDSGATKITIEILDGGETLIRITDDGSGIHPEDVEKAFLPHATSKIETIDDLYKLKSLGFRGEALASIASVAKVNLKTKIGSEDFGTEIEIHGGEIKYLNSCGCNKGTVIEVRDIFYNVPARKKFLKSKQREAALISDIVSRIALAYPNISFKFFSNNKNVLTTFGTGQLTDTIRNIYGKNVVENLSFFEGHGDIVSIYGYIGNSELSRGSRNNQSIFVNNRFIKNKLIATAVENAVKSFFMVNKYPFFIIFLDIYPEFLDVNVHPTKAEIKFQDESRIFKIVFDTIHKVVRDLVKDDFLETDKEEINEKPIMQVKLPVDLKAPEIPTEVLVNSNNKNPKENNYLDYQILQNDKSQETQKQDNIRIDSAQEKDTLWNTTISQDVNSEIAVKENEINTSYNKSSVEESVAKVSIEKEEVNDFTNSEIKPVEKFPMMRIIGQYSNTYILMEGYDGLYLVDQHAAHEKIIFEKYIKEMKLSKVVSQILMLPEVIEMTPYDFSIYKENHEMFTKAGFLIEDFGENTVSVREVPVFLGRPVVKELFTNILDNLKNYGSGSTLEVKYYKIATLACKSAIKANDNLDIREMIALIEELRFIDEPFNCPHGRPTIIKMTNNEIEKRFKRIQ